MKKVISFLIAIMMMSTTVLADTADGLRELIAEQAEIMSCKSKTVLSAKLNEPLEILDSVPKDEYFDVDYGLLANELAKAEITAECAYNMSEDYKKMQMELSLAADVPIHLNDGLKIDAWTKFGVWYNYDVTDAENPVFEIIVKSPFEPYYEYGNLIDEYDMDLSSVMNIETIKQASDDMAKAITDNATVTKTADGYKVKFDNNGIAGLISDSLDMVEKYTADTEAKESFESNIEEISDAVSGISILGEDGLTVSVKKNSKGDITAYVEELHLDFNVFDIAETLGVPTDGLVRDKSQVDITLSSVTEISEHNTATVTMPELTDENSRSMYGSYYSENYYSSDKSPLFTDNEIYYPLNEVTEPTGADVTIEGNKITLNDETLECDETQLITYENEIYVTEDVLEFIGVYYTDVEYDTEEKKFSFVFEYYSDGVGNTESWVEPEEEYISPYLEVDFMINRGVYSYNGIAYMPVYEFVSQMYEGEFTFGYKSLVYTATAENVHGITTMSVRDGDDFVTVNGTIIKLDAPAKEVNGVLNIPMSFADVYGYSGYARTTYYTYGDASTLYFFTKQNPLYGWDESGVDPYLDVWVWSDRLPHIENGEVCVPMYDLLLEMYDGTFSFTENGMEYVATGENDYGITKVSVTVGDSFVMVDDKKVELENKVVSVNDVIRVPIGFTEALGFTTDWVSVYDDSTTYNFSMPNPKYAEE